MKEFDNLATMRACLPDDACAPTAAVLADMQDFIDGLVDEASFTALFGAPLYLVEQVGDLEAVCSFDVVRGQRVSLLDGASDAFDVAEWIAGGLFARFVTIESTEGGPQYLVPRKIADQVPFVGAAIKLLSCDV